MTDKNHQSSQRNRFLKLSLKKNRVKNVAETKKINRSSDVIVIDESFDRLHSDIQRNIQSTPKIYSPIVLSDSCEESFAQDTPRNILYLAKEPSKIGNISLDRAFDELQSEMKESRPSIDGWSPAQNIICATPRYETIPSTPKDVANESLEECTMKRIQDSQKKLLNNLYGEVWKSIPTLFKAISHQHVNLDVVSKKLQFDDEDDNDNIKPNLKECKKLYLTGSNVKQRNTTADVSDKERKSKKKLFTEKIPNTPEPPRQRLKNNRNANSTTKKCKVKSVTELVELMGNDVDQLTDKIKNTTITPVHNRLSFMASLADNVPSWRCHVEALQYRDDYKQLREKLARRLYDEFNRVVFKNALDEDMPIIWDTKLRSTAGTTTNRLLKNAKGARIRTSSIKLSIKVVDAPQRLRDTLVHEMCHAATWLVDGELRAGHGPLWKKWATRALRAIPELGEISRCHDLEIHFKYSYKCSKCGYSIQRHSKSIDITKKCCGYCRGTFELNVNKKTKDGAIVSTPARKGEANDFALYVKENYGTLKDGTKTHAQVMKLLGEQFSARKNKKSTVGT